MRWLVVTLAVGCGGDARPSRADCAKFLDHAAELERYASGDDKPMLDRSDLTRRTFLDRCVVVMHPEEIRCALAEKDLVGIDRCVDRHALARRLDGDEGDPMAELAVIRDQVCACVDLACTRRASKMLEDYGRRWAEQPPERFQPTVDQMNQCIARLARVQVPLDLTHDRLVHYQVELVPRWQRTHPDTPCPTLAALAAGEPSTDGWDAPLIVRCAPDLAITSAGPDGQPGTSDDLTP